MPPSTDQPGQGIFRYPAAEHETRHGPSWYTDDADYKPWLRDEFDYRCVYCLCRETWMPDGHRAFSVEHLIPRSRAISPSEYASLAYACCVCNATRCADPLPLHPSAAPGLHLEILADGTARPLSLVGAAFIRLCGLQRPDLVSFRKRMLDTVALLAASDRADAADLLRSYLSYPDDLPDLSRLKPPGGNAREEGKRQSAFARRLRGELPATY